MKNINKIMFVCVMMTVGSLSAFGGNRMGSDPDTYRPGKETQNYFIFTSDNLAPLTINGTTVNVSGMYGKYYPLLGTEVPGNTTPITGGTITLKDSQSNAMKYKFASVVISTDQTPPQGAQLIAQYKLPVGGNSFASMTNYVFGVLVQ